jgi:transcriptional regulator NrdR family protein
MFGRDVAFEDPSTWGNDWNPEREIGALETSDVVVANMWRESIGTTIGVVHARLRGIPVVLVDPNYLHNRILEGWIAPEKPVPSLKDAKARTAAILDSLAPIQNVVKQNGATVPFSRQKLIRSIRTACSAAGVEDSYLPALLVNSTMRRLQSESGGAAVKTGTIKNVIHVTLDAIGGNPVYTRKLKEEAAAVRDAWKKKETYKTAEELFDEAIEQVKKVEAERDAFRAALSSRPAPESAAPPAREAARAAWKHVIDAVREAERRYPKDLEFHERAFRSAEDSPFATPAKVFRALAALADCARDRRTARARSAKVPGVREWFDRHREKASWLEYKPSESGVTMGKWGAERKFVHAGKTLEMQQHLAIGSGGPDTTLRIYFCPHPDPARAEFLVGHVGRHPTNTRS